MSETDPPMGAKAPATDTPANLQDSIGEDRLTIIAPTYHQAALEFHRRKMSEKGYRLGYRIEQQRMFLSDGPELEPLFDGQLMFVATFVKQSS